MERMKTTVEIYECPSCGRLRFPEGDEKQYGPPECDHGLWFGTGPDGGGEAEMVLVKFQRLSISREAEFDSERSAGTGAIFYKPGPIQGEGEAAAGIRNIAEATAEGHTQLLRDVFGPEKFGHSATPSSGNTDGDNDD